jgi:hypothetical protein
MFRTCVQNLKRRVSFRLKNSYARHTMHDGTLQSLALLATTLPAMAAYHRSASTIEFDRSAHALQAVGVRVRRIQPIKPREHGARQAPTIGLARRRRANLRRRRLTRRRLVVVSAMDRTRTRAYECA